MLQKVEKRLRLHLRLIPSRQEHCNDCKTFKYVYICGRNHTYTDSQMQSIPSLSLGGCWSGMRRRNPQHLVEGP